MKLASLLITAIASLAMVSPASAGGGLDFEFTFTADGGGPSPIVDDTIGIFTLEMGSALPTIATIELEINGLSHTNPWDIDIVLIAPTGVSLDILKDRGDQSPVSGIDLLFREGGAQLPTGLNFDDPLNGSPYSDGAVLPEGTIRIANILQSGSGFGDAFDGSPSRGLNAWILLVTDDTFNGHEGSFDSFTLRGTFVPEPMSLSLLAAGAFAVFGLRRKR